MRRRVVRLLDWLDDYHCVWCTPVSSLEASGWVIAGAVFLVALVAVVLVVGS